MSTETKQDPRDPGLGALLGAATVALGAGACAAVPAGLVAGGAGVRGVLLGIGLVVTILAFGAFAVHVVSMVMPSASLLVALLTYALQLAVLLAALALLDRSAALDGDVSRGWLVGGVVVGTLTWITVQTWLSARARVLLYDLPEAGVRSPEEAGAR